LQSCGDDVLIRRRLRVNWTGFSEATTPTISRSWSAAEPAGFVPPNPAVVSDEVSGLLALFALQKLKQLVVRAECSYDVMDQEQGNFRSPGFRMRRARR